MIEIRTADGDGVFAAAEVLRRGGVAVFPTETVYGVGVAWGNTQALERLRQVKGRDANKPFQILIASFEQVGQLGAVPSAKAWRVLRRFWPGGLTAVLPGPDGSTLGLRFPDHAVVAELVRCLGAPVVASSANPAGEPPAADATQAKAYFAGDARIGILLEAGTSREAQPSTVADLTGDLPKILREGAVAVRELMDCWNSV